MFQRTFASYLLLASSAASASLLGARGLSLIPDPLVVPTDPLARRAVPACQADNCARAVTGTSPALKPSLSSRVADCNSFFAYTVTPLTTITVTSYTSTETDVSTTLLTTTSTEATVTPTTTTAPVPHKKRQVVTTATTQSPTAVPAYASLCSGSARYSSACSCLSGVTKSTSTAPTSTITVVVSAITTTSTATTQVTTTTTTTTSTSVATVTPMSCQDLAPTYQAPNGKRFNVACDGTVYHTSQNGDNYSHVAGYSSYRQCADVCAAASNCVAFVFAPGYDGCGLYSYLQPAYNNPIYQSGTMM